MQQTINTFNGGMDKDSSVNSVKNSTYYHAEDIKVITTDGDSNHSVINFRGNSLNITLPNTNEKIIGSAHIREQIILFTSTVDTQVGGHGYIYRVDYDTDCGATLNLVYDHPDLNFSAFHPIEAVGRWENECTRRVVFSDYNEATRSINISDPNFGTGAYTGPTSYGGITPSDLDIHPDATLLNPVLTNIIGGGNLAAGVYQYAYRLLSDDGKQTIIAHASKLIPLYQGTDNTNTSDIEGSVRGTNTGKAIQVDIDLSTINVSNYSTLTLIRIFKDTYGNAPVIHQIDTVNVDGGTDYTVTDSGNESNAIAITFADYVQNFYPFHTNKTFEVKDNILLASNIKEDCFEPTCIDTDDFVTLRYAFGGVPTASHQTFMQATHGLTAREALYSNPYNDDSGRANGSNPTGTINDWSTSHRRYRFRLDNQLGGESPNGYVKYTFKNEEFLLDDGLNSQFGSTPFGDGTFNISSEYTHVRKRHDNFASSYIAGHKTGYKRGEIYRFGIVFFSKKGTASFVYYIGDIRMPSVTNAPITEVDAFGNVKGFTLGVDFEIALPACLTAQISGYKIVRVDRNVQNSTKLYQGVGVKYYTHGGVNFTPPSIGSRFTMSSPNNYNGGTSNSDMISFFSPEQTYNAFTSGFVDGNDVIRSVGLYNNISAEDVASGGASTTPGENPANPGYIGGQEVVDKTRVAGGLPGFAGVDNTAIITGFVRTGGGQGDFALQNVNTQNFRNYGIYGAGGLAVDSSDYTQGAFQGTNLTLTLNHQGANVFSTPVAGGVANTAYVPTANPGNFTRNILEYQRYVTEQYGGTGPEKVASNVFIPCTHLLRNGATTTTVFGGDIYVGYFDFLRLFWDSFAQTRGLSANVTDDNDSYFEVAMIPVESRINLELTHGNTYNKGNSFDHDDDGNPDGYRRVETGGTEGDMFLYNTVYSEVDRNVTYFPKPIEFSDCSCPKTQDVRTFISDAKINGETVDSWSKFRTNNYLDVDTKYGPINRLLNLNDEIYYLQDRGFGKFLINERALVVASDGVSTELGTGQGLRDYGYISTKHGCIHQWGALATDNSIWYFDATHRKMMRFTGGGNGPISDLKGFHGFFNRTLHQDVLLTKSDGGDNPLLDKGVHCTYDTKEKIVVYTFLGVEKRSNGDTSSTKPILAGTTLNPGEHIVIDGQLVQYTGNTTQTFNAGFTWQQYLDDSAITNPPYLVNRRTGYTMAFNEMNAAFNSFYKFRPNIYVNNNGTIFSPNPENNTQVYRHGCGEHGVYYDNDPVESMISIVVNERSDYNKILRFIEFNSKVNMLHDKGTFYDEDFNGVVNPLIESSLRNETISAVRVYNDNQDTGKVDLSQTRQIRGVTVNKYIERRFDKWRLKIPRDNQLTDNRPSHSNVGKSRMRSTYFVVEFYFQNNNNKTFKMDRVLSYFDFQMF